MDSVTQAVLGAAIGELVVGKEVGYKGALIGAAIATIPDLDVALYLVYDSYDMLSIHRGISHSILFCIVLSILLAILLKKIKLTSSVRFSNLWILSFSALITHIILDTFTAYGTQLLLPFSNTRIGLDSINVVDPVYTIPLIIGLTLSLSGKKKNRDLYNKLGLIISTIYLCSTLFVKYYVHNHFVSELQDQAIEYNALLTMPVGIGSVHWYGVAKTDNGISMQKYSILKNEPSTFTYFETNDDLLEGLDENLVQKMKWFSKGFYTVSEVNDEIRFYNLQVDMRGIIDNGQVKAPTAGYFILGKNPDGSAKFSSGQHQ